MLGHDGPPQGFWRENLISGAPLTICPVMTRLRAREEHAGIVEEFDRHIDTYYPAYQDGHLLVAGGVADQPARYLSLMHQIRAVQRAVSAKHAKLTTQKTDET